MIPVRKASHSHSCGEIGFILVHNVNFTVWPSRRGDWGESKRPATNFPGIPVDSDRFDCLDEKGGLGVEARPESPVTNRGFFVRFKTGGW